MMCLCALLAATLSAASADLSTTAQFTALGYPEANPGAAPFVQGRGSRGEFVLGGLTAGAYVMADRVVPEPWKSLGLGMAFVVHATLAIRNVRGGGATEVPRIMAPVFTVGW